MQGKGKQSPHKQIKDRKPVIQVDFASMTSSESEEQVILLTAVDIRTQLSMAVVVPSKSIKMSRYAVVELQRFIFETGRTQGIIQCDDEQAIKSVVK